MIPLRSRRLVAGALVAASVLLRTTLVAADNGTAGDEELRRKTQEVERLKEELNRAQSDLKKLEAENQQLRTNKPSAASVAGAAPAESRKELPAIATLPPLEPEQTIDVSELVAHFVAEPAAAGWRYAKKVFRVKGAVHALNADFATRGYSVRLESAEKSVVVLCRFRVPGDYVAVYTKRSGQVLVARLAKNTERQLLQVGDAVTIEGTCKGLKNGELIFTGCQTVR